MTKAPDFSLLDQHGELKSLKDYSGKWLILYFYPKDNTPGCTKEACNFRDGRDILVGMGAEVIGVSKDSVQSHQNFASKYNLNFTILSNPEHDVIEAYGAWGAKKMMGREYQGILRNTYLINPNGDIVKIYQSVNPLTHPKQIIEDLEQLQK